MGTMEITIDTEIIQQLVLGERDEAIRQLVETVLNEVLDAEMDEHLNAKRYERTDDRQGHRNGYYNRNLTMRVGPVELRKPRDREGNFSVQESEATSNCPPCTKGKPTEFSKDPELN